MPIAEQVEVNDLIFGIIKPKCYELVKLLDVVQFVQGDCFRDTVSKLLGFLIILFAPLSKLPQIITIVKEGSVEGLNTMTYLFETFGYLIYFIYNYRNGYPFSSYGEVLFIYIQNLVILLLVAAYRGLSAFHSLFFIALVGGIFLMMPECIVPLTVLAMIQSMQVVISTASNVPQIYENMKNGSTGQLSSITVFLFFVGSVVRVFTTLQEAPDPILLVSIGLAGFYNAVLFLQVVIYSGGKKKGTVDAGERECGPEDREEMFGQRWASGQLRFRGTRDKASRITIRL